MCNGRRTPDQRSVRMLYLFAVVASLAAALAGDASPWRTWLWICYAAAMLAAILVRRLMRS